MNKELYIQSANHHTSLCHIYFFDNLEIPFFPSSFLCSSSNILQVHCFHPSFLSHTSRSSIKNCKLISKLLPTTISNFLHSLQRTKRDPSVTTTSTHSFKSSMSISKLHTALLLLVAAQALALPTLPPSTPPSTIALSTTLSTLIPRTEEAAHLERFDSDQDEVEELEDASDHPRIQARVTLIDKLCKKYGGKMMFCGPKKPAPPKPEPVTPPLPEDLGPNREGMALPPKPPKEVMPWNQAGMGGEGPHMTPQPGMSGH